MTSNRVFFPILGTQNKTKFGPKSGTTPGTSWMCIATPRSGFAHSPR